MGVRPMVLVLLVLLVAVILLLLQRPETQETLVYLYGSVPRDVPGEDGEGAPRYVSTLRGVPDWLLEKAQRVINPYKGCQELYPGLDVLSPYTGVYLEEMRAHNATYWKSGEVLSIYGSRQREPDGYSLRCCPAQINLMLDLARIPWVKTICEVGFNAGHSAVTWLAAKPETKLYAFDIGYHSYTKPLGEYIEGRFPGRLELILGDSGVTLPRFIWRHPEVKCDILSIDGGHFYKYAIKDFNNFRKMANPLNILIFDDYPMGDHTLRDQDLGRVWEEKRENGQLTEIFRCNFLKDKANKVGMKGFTVGQIN